VIFDAPATGHALEMLRVPRLLTEIAPVGLLRKDAESAWQTLTDAERSGVVLVTLAEELAVSETLAFVAELEALKLPVAELFVNARVETLFSPEDSVTLLGARARLHEGARQLVDIATDRALRERIQGEQAERLAREWAREAVTLPWAATLATGEDPEPLVQALLDAWGGAPPA
jgi:anion-transporting  ArsA/GET3 family ATPase